MDRVLETTPAADIYATTGIQFLPFNTAYQLVAATATAQLAAAKHLLLIPDLIGYWLTGRIAAELTNASTTQLVDARTGQWSADLIRRLAIPASLMPGLRRPGDSLGPVRSEAGLAKDTVVTAVGSHDTASAVVGVPARAENFAFISCGTWSLVGVELDQPILTEDSRRANFRAWQAQGLSLDLGELLREAAQRPAYASVVDLDDPSFLAPGDLPARIGDACLRTGEPEPADPPAVLRCILDSLALAHQRAVADACRLSGRDVEIIHLVGGGARNELLCQLTADACGLPVEAGPVEAGALGNALVQARALRAVSGDLTTIRGLLRATQEIRSYQPSDRSARASAVRAQARLTSHAGR